VLAHLYLLVWLAMLPKYFRNYSRWMCQLILSPIKHLPMIHSLMCQLASILIKQPPLLKISRRSFHFAQKMRWQNMLKQWLALWIRVPKFLITVTQLGMKLVKAALNAPLHFLVLCRHIYGHYFVKVRDHLDGLHYQGIQKIFIAPIKLF